MEKYLYKSTSGNYSLVMAYPAIEEFALASLGYLWLYKIADMTEGVNAIRCSTDSIPSLKNIGSVAFSMSFDFDFMGVFEILEKLNIPLYSKDRDENCPLIFSGGPVITTNPRPYEAFFDFMLIGDGEESFRKILDILKNNSRSEALELIKDVEGVYIAGGETEKATVPLQDVIYTPILSDKSYFKDTFIIEVARGCMNRCAFCTASYTNLPFRCNEYEKIIEAIELGLKYTNKIALLGGQKHSTIAIEAASERLRRFINKNLKEEQILNAVKVARENGLKGLKIYSMIGIPTETQEDIEEFIRLGKRIKEENKGFNIEFSFSSFVPKPHTPLQWSEREDTKSLEKKQRFLEKEFAKLGIASKFSSIKWDYWQTVLSRGGGELAPILVNVYKLGGKVGAYKTSLKELKIEINNKFSLEDILPWDVIKMEPCKVRLIKEFERLCRRNKK